MQAESGRGGVAEVVRDAIEVYLSLHRARRRGVELFFEDSATGEEGRIWLLPGPVPGDRP